MPGFETRNTATDLPDVIAPDGSEIRLASAALAGGSMVLCTLPPGGVTRPVYHRTVEEMWHCVSGRGRLWRRLDGPGETVELRPGVSLSIPLGTRFQFRNDGSDALRIVIATLPPWPGEDEAIPCEGVWPAALQAAPARPPVSGCRRARE